MVHGVDTQTPTKTRCISHKLQQGFTDWNPNPLVPKTFQQPVESQALTEVIEDIAALARAPLEERLCQQQEQIQKLQSLVYQLEQTVQSLG